MLNRPTASHAPDLREDDEPLLNGRWVAGLGAFLVAVGLLSRLSPLTDPHGRLLRQFMTEDGYLMQTVARNLALGHGLSVSDGTITTNGVQPLATLIFAGFHYLAGGSKGGGIAGVMIFSALVSLSAAAFLYALARKWLAKHPDGQPLALLVATLWFASPTIVKHSMNGLETGLYFLVSLAALYTFAAFLENDRERYSPAQMIGLGGMFGLCFLVRNDAAFLIAAVLLARLILRWPQAARQWSNRIIEAVVPGLVSIAIASPWLIYNYRFFGSIVPISGISEAMENTGLGANLIQVPAPLLDFVTLVLPIPLSLRANVPTVAVCLLVVGAAIALAGRMLWRWSKTAPFLALTYGIFGVLLIAFYGVYFGAPYFMSRYLSVLSPALALVGIAAAYRLLMSIRAQLRLALAAVAAAAALLIMGLNARLYLNGLEHEHFQVVDWVEAHVPPETWVGAPQTGTLGFFHDRTINLDGKVNPEALRARLDEGGVIPYVLRSKIDFVADWAGIALWSRIEKDDFDKKFELIVLDTAANLAVLKRVGS